MCRCLMKPVEEKKEKEERKEKKPVKKVVLKEDMKTIKREEVKTVNSVDPVKREEMKAVNKKGVKAVNPVNPTQQNKQSKQANTPFPRCKHCGGWGKDLVRSSGFCLHCERLLSQSRSTQAQSRSIPTQSTQSTQQVLLLFILS